MLLKYSMVGKMCLADIVFFFITINIPNVLKFLDRILCGNNFQSLVIKRSKFLAFNQVELSYVIVTQKSSDTFNLCNKQKT